MMLACSPMTLPIFARNDDDADPDDGGE